MRKEHLNRESYIKTAESVWDDYRNLGYKYKGRILRHSVSGLFYVDPRKTRILDKLEELLYTMIEDVKMIKKFRNFAIDKDSHLIN